MKTNKIFLTLWIVFAISIFSSTDTFSQDKKTETIKIKTSAVCGMCKDRIENGMAFEKGIKDVSLDVDTKEVTIKYNTKSTTPDELRKKISKLGYDADGVPCDTVAYKKLPACCKKDAPKH